MPATAAARKSRPGVNSRARRDELVTSHMRLVRHTLEKIAERLPKHVDREDLYEAGMVGLIHAAERYDTRRNTQFSTYAVTRIRGAILDALREEDWLPRSLRNEIAHLDAARSSLEHEMSRRPTDDELAERLGMKKKKVAKLLRFSDTCAFQSLDALQENAVSEHMDDAYPTHGTDDSPLDRAILEEHKELLADAIGRLPESERVVVSLYYFEQALLRDIAEVLGVSDSRVCQIHRAALARLQRMMNEADRPAAALAIA